MTVYKTQKNPGSETLQTRIYTIKLKVLSLLFPCSFQCFCRIDYGNRKRYECRTYCTHRNHTPGGIVCQS